MGIKGLVWSSSAMGVLLNEGIGDTIRVSLTPRPGGDRREEVYAACELLQSLGPALVLAERDRVSRLRPHDQHRRSRSSPSASRTTSARRCRSGRPGYDGVETMTLAVMGCVVNGPGESKAANIGISLPGTGEAPQLPRLHRRRARHDAARHLRRARGSVPAPRR